MKAIILSAGYGTRLKILTETTPKPLLLVGNISIIDRILNGILSVKAISEIFIITNNKYSEAFNHWYDTRKDDTLKNYSIQIVNDKTNMEKDRLGPIGDLVYLFNQHNIDEDILILAGDNLFEGNINDLIDERYSHNASILCVYKFANFNQVENKYGVVTINAHNRVIEFHEKPAHAQSSLAATAMYLIRKEDLFLVHSLYERQAGTELNLGELIGEFLRQNVPVYCSFVPMWFDIGCKEDYEIANIYYESK